MEPNTHMHLILLWEPKRLRPLYPFCSAVQTLQVQHYLCSARFYPQGAHIDSQSDGAAIRYVKSVNGLKE